MLFLFNFMHFCVMFLYMLADRITSFQVRQSFSVPVDLDCPFYIISLYFDDVFFIVFL